MVKTHTCTKAHLQPNVAIGDFQVIGQRKFLVVIKMANCTLREMVGARKRQK